MRQPFLSLLPSFSTIRIVAGSAFFSALVAGTTMAGGHVDGDTPLDPAKAFGGSGVSPTFNNEQFNDKVLVGVVHNDLIRTPSTADPVSTVSGNNYHDETDIQIRGRNGLGYVFTRTYNSAPSATAEDKGLGFGWSHSYGMRLKSNDFGRNPNSGDAKNSDNQTSSITYTDERGGEQNFVVTATTDTATGVTTYPVSNPKGVFDSLRLNTPVDGQHTLFFRNGTSYVFQTVSGDLEKTPKLQARLTTIKNAWGDVLALGYSATTGNLETVTDNLNISGRTGLSFTYHTDNKHLKDIKDWAGRTWGFTYISNELTGATNPLIQKTSYAYHAGHLLKEVKKPLQRAGKDVKTTFNYYRNGRVFNYYDALGNTETLDYDLYRKRTRVTDPRGGIREYDYDEDGAMVKMVEPDGGVLLFENQNNGLRNKKYDALGYATEYSYRKDQALGADTWSDTAGNVSLEKDAEGRTTATTYGPFDQPLTRQDKRGTVTTTSYYASPDAATTDCQIRFNRPKSVTVSALTPMAGGTPQTAVKLRDYCWYGNGVPHKLIDYIDTAGQLTRTTQYSYEAGSNFLNVSDTYVSASDNPGVRIRTHVEYDGLGRQESVTQYRRTSPTNAALMALTTRYEYDKLDRVVKVTRPDGRVDETVYDANGQVEQEKVHYPTAAARAQCVASPIAGHIACTEKKHEYDAADRRILTRDIWGNKQFRYAYDEAGNLTAQTDANNHTVNYEYDAMNRRTAVIDGNGHRTRTAYDQAGHVVAVTNALGKSVRNTYDSLGRLINTTNALNYPTEYRYDKNGNLNCVRDANGLSLATDAGHQPLNGDGCTESFIYDELGRLLQSKDAQNKPTRYRYDLLGNRTAVTDARNLTTQFVYDGLGRLEETIDPLVQSPVDKTDTYATDEAGNVYQATDRKGQVSQHRYDGLNRLVRTDHLADGTFASYTYDDFGDLVGTENADVAYTYTYNIKHQLKSKTDGRFGKALGWTYDTAGNILTKTGYPGDVTTYQYDGGNRLVAETNPAHLQASYHYDGTGRLQARILSNGARSQYFYDNGGRLARLLNTTANNLKVSDTGYTRDRVGNLLSRTEQAGTQQPAGTTTYAYDPEYRLLEADYPNIADDESYTYDNVGNRLTYTQNGVTRHYYTAAGNRLAWVRLNDPTAGPIEEQYSYDDNGNLKTITVPGDAASARNLAFTWDAGDHLVKADTAAFAYDPAGYRIRKAPNANPADTLDYHLEGEHLEAVYNSQPGPVLKAQYFRGGVIDEIINAYQRNAAGTLVNSTFHHDPLQSVLGQSGHGGSVLAAQSYTAFGKAKQALYSNNELKYTGRERDGATGFYYYRARYYDPVIGRFTSEDPKGFGAGDTNFYAYVGNNPVNANDPTGNITFSYYAQLSLAGWVSEIGQKIGIFDAPVSSAQIGVAESFSFFDGAERDSGIFVSGSAGGGMSNPLNPGNNINFGLLGFGALNLSVGISPGSVSDLAGRDDVLSFKIPSFSFSYNQDSQTGSYSGLSVGVAAGLAAGAEQTLTGVLSQKYGFIGYENPSPAISGTANGGFILYPNKSNTNQMKSVYSKP